MSSYAHRALRATVAAAGMAALGISFVGTAAAAAPKTDEGADVTDAQHSGTGAEHALDNQSPSTPSVLDQHDAPGIHNDLVNFELPRVQTAAYRTSWRGIPVSHHKDGDDVCHGLGGSQHLPFHNSFQHPCQSHDNSFYKVKVGHPDGVPISNHHYAAQPADAPHTVGLVNQNPDPSDVSQDDSTPLSSLGLDDATDLDQMDGYNQVGPQPV